MLKNSFISKEDIYFVYKPNNKIRPVNENDCRWSFIEKEKNHKSLYGILLAFTSFASIIMFL